MALVTKEDLVARFTQLTGLIKDELVTVPVNQTEITGSDVTATDVTVSTPATSGSIGIAFNEKSKNLKDTAFTEEKSGILFDYTNNKLSIIKYNGAAGDVSIAGESLEIPLGSSDTESFTEAELTQIWNNAFNLGG